MEGRPVRMLSLAIAVTIALAIVSLFIGVSNISLPGLLSASPEDRPMQVLLISRIPRTLAIILSGNAMAVAGLVMQMIVRNRFVEPSTAGTTESASLGFLVATLVVPGWPLMGKMLIAAGFALAGMGRDFTTNLGLNYQRVMVLGLVIVSLVSATVLVTAGSIPFLGLIIPNLVSLMVGDNMRRTVPWVVVMGAGFVLACDILGRIIRFPYEIPISVVVGVIGSAVFLYLLLRTRRHA